MITKLRKKLLDEPRPMYKTAGLMGIHSATISLYSLGRKNIAPQHLILMCRFWQCDASELIGYLDEEDIIKWIDANSKEVAV